MANKANIEEKVNYEEAPELALDKEMEMQQVPMREQQPALKAPERVVRVSPDHSGLVNCLRNERVIVRHVNKQTGLVTDPKHVLFGGMSENAKRTFCVPLLRSGGYVNVLTNAEKDYLEYILGLEPNALSVHNMNNNFWSDANENGIAKVVLTKQDNYLNLADPVDYIKYKILLAWKDKIAPSIQALQDHRKATYEFVIIKESDKTSAAKVKLTAKKESYKEFGKIENDIDILRLVVELMDGRPTAPNTSIDVLQTKVSDLIESNAKMFLTIVKDELLPTKVLIKKAIEAGIISRRGDYLYLREDNSPLCEMNQEPTFNIAAAYLAAPKHQELKFSIEAKVKE